MSKKTCNQCAPMVIQGVFCHESGCPNMRKEWDDEMHEWVDPEPDDTEWDDREMNMSGVDCRSCARELRSWEADDYGDICFDCAFEESDERDFEYMSHSDADPGL